MPLGKTGGESTHFKVFTTGWMSWYPVVVSRSQAPPHWPSDCKEQCIPRRSWASPLVCWASPHVCLHTPSYMEVSFAWGQHEMMSGVKSWGMPSSRECDATGRSDEVGCAWEGVRRGSQGNTGLEDTEIRHDNINIQTSWLKTQDSRMKCLISTSFIIF